MDHWLDSLSEDWVSQPNSPLSSSSKQSSVFKDASSPNSNGSQSRIPRYKPRSASNLSIAAGKEDGLGSSIRRASGNEIVLREKTQSNLNATRNRIPIGEAKSGGPRTKSKNTQGRHVSADSIPMVPQDTVQVKASPIKNIDGEMTPDWKRRVLKENMGKGDLFSPIGLESLFRPPTIGSKQKAKPVVARKRSLKDGCFPSSPPQYPNPARRSMKIQNQTPEKLTLAPSPPSEISGNKNSKYLVPQEIELPSTMGIEANSGFDIKARPSGAIKLSDEVARGTPVLPTAPTPPQVEAYNGKARRSSPSFMDQSRMSNVTEKASDENISPFYVSRHNTVDGRIEYAAIDMSMQRLRSQMDKLRIQQQNIPSSRSSDHDVDYTNSRLSDKLLLPGELDELTTQSLPDDLSMGTDAYAANGGFVSIHRGGYSNDGSFQRRPLSPSLLQDLDGPSMKAQAHITQNIMPSPQLPIMFSQTKSSTPSSPPKTPKQQTNDVSDSNERPRSSGSPLKLFDKYDTFTNEKLVRRMSKFEETMHRDLQESSSEKNVQGRSSPLPGPKRLLRQSHHQQNRNVEIDRRISSFGSSDLDDYMFPTHKTPGLRLQDASSPELPQSDPYHFRSECSRLDRSANAHARKSRNFGVRKKDGDDLQEEDAEEDARAAQERSAKRSHHRIELGLFDVQQTRTGKRLPYSPAKDPTPKRRRTLRTSDEVENGIAQLRQQLDIEEPRVSSAGRKRKDALYNSDRQVADPKVLALRQIRQPKLPAPSPVSSPAQHMILQNAGYSPQPAQTSVYSKNTTSDMDPPTQIVAGALATVALNTVQDITCGSRKASVTTADFFNEAQQIMQLIRNQGRPRSSHATIGGSEVGQPSIAEESVVEDSTKDEFSRPPSREGGSTPRLRIPAQKNARVISHLRKFEDQETLGLALSSSIKSLQMSKTEKIPEHAGPEREENDTHRGTESDPPNIRISERTFQSNERKSPSSARNLSTSGLEKLVHSQSSQSTSGPSTSRSNPTGSSHSSAHRLVIAPKTVAHLLSDQMAGMVFDRQKQLWIKRKGSANVENDDNHDHTVSDGTEEDFFGDIPDLSVNEMEELKRVKDSMSSVKSSGSAANNVSSHDQAIVNNAITKVVNATKTLEDIRPRTADGKILEAIDNSSAPSKCSHFAWSGPQPGTRATSWGEEAPPPKEIPRGFSTDPDDQHEAEVEHEISILEGRESRIPKHQNGKNRQARVVTVAFSSPLVDQREPLYGNDDSNFDIGEGQSELDANESPVRQDHRPSMSNSRRASFGLLQKSSRRTSSRRLSFSNQAYNARPMSRLDEQDEMSLVHYSAKGHPVTLEVAVSTPLPISRSLIVPPTTGRQSSVSFHLSPLPDFTVHQIDKPLDGRLGQITRRSKQARTNQPDGRLSLAAQELVKNLTDLEPYELYWDYIRSINLHDRELKTLHMLDEFCGGVEELDVSNNQIGELNGIPSTVRRLNIRENCLSDLAAWNSLYNLQYMDVSENNLRSVKGFQNLVHLRALKADYNEIRSLNGLEDLDGLISLSLRGNMLQEVDFKSFHLQRLSTLDLRDNEIVEASNLDCLASLKNCDLSYNDLETLEINNSDCFSNLETLKISNNYLTTLDVAAMPKLKVLDIDKNSIAKIENLKCLKQLETLSWREQRLDSAADFSEVQYNDCYEVWNLYLSGNILTDFAPSTRFLNLHNLELASTGLQTLPSDFGLQCPNVRILNANYNAIQDLRPLLGIVKLEKLLLAGNRVSRLRRTAAVLDRVGKSLLQIDLRNNPLTVGFYLPQEPTPRDEKRLVPTHGRRRLRADDDDDDNDDGDDAEQHDPQVLGAYLLPAVDKTADNLSRQRLDEDTKLRRRVYEMLLVHHCKALECLDGLSVDRGMVARRDGVWERLVELGVLRARRDGGREGEGE